MLKKIRKIFLLVGLSLAVIIPLSFVGDNYFEISKNLDIFATLYKEVNTYYVDDIQPAKFMRTGIDAMLSSLDPYTNYISEADIEGYRFQTTGKYGGIGASIQKHDEQIVVGEPYEGFAAYKAGLMAGDVILEIDGKTTAGKSTEDISKILKGAPGTIVKLLIQRPGDNNSSLKTVTREEIKIKSVPYYGMLNENIGYIKLSQFTEQCGKDVADALKDLESKHTLKGIVFDLRGNPGGLLNEAVNVSNVFIDKGVKVVSTKGKIDEWNKDYTSINPPVDINIPLVILANGGSASASEIVTGCVQDLDRGVVVGQKTFGKGLVQTTRPLSYGTQLKVTTAHYYTPSGRCIQALDYAHRNEDGSVGKIPDSLKNAFKTKNGRPVYDGGGVDPDIPVEAQKISNISISLIKKSLMFDFATQYRQKHETIPAAKDFKLTDSDFNDFVAFINNKSYDYTTKTEDAISDLEKDAEKENYLTAIKPELDELKLKVKHDKEQDIQKNKNEIMRILLPEIVSRYYYQNGRLESSLSNDPEVLKAIEVLNDKPLYEKTLTALK